MDFRPILRICGWLLCGLAASMLVPAMVDMLARFYYEGQVFLSSAGITLFIGLALILATGGKWRQLSVRQIYLAAAAAWLVPIPFAALPFMFGPVELSISDAIFEATSGLTTTGSTVIAGLDRVPPGTLVWRALLQWMGGIGIIVLAVSVLPVLNVGGMQMFRVDSLSPAERLAPRATRLGGMILGVYCGLTVALALALWAVGMSGFDAMLHAMTTISTGGFSTYDTSIAHFSNMGIDMVILVGMILGGMPFLLFLRALQGNWRWVTQDEQIRWYLGLMALGAVAVSLWLADTRGVDTISAIRYGAFTVASVMTGTGHVTVDFSDWAGMPLAVMFFLTFVGGCAGSTAAGIKVFRLQFLLANALVQVRHLLRPHAVLIPTFNKKTISEDVLESVMGFLFVYVLGFACLSMALGFLGLDFVTAISGAASAIANLGPGFGPVIGPDSTYAPLPDLAKWLLAAGMVFGRLEMFILLVLFVPSFWKQ